LGFFIKWTPNKACIAYARYLQFHRHEKAPKALGDRGFSLGFIGTLLGIEARDKGVRVIPPHTVDVRLVELAYSPVASYQDDVWLVLAERGDATVIEHSGLVLQVSLCLYTV
tara:strand:+ start:82163 stop:82498 length:336 start_codon:yes stop_codon:yes gene_type:complete